MKPVVLIIDDEETLRKLLGRVIELEGYHVLHASTAKEALRLVNTETVHVIVSDVKLSDANGVDLSGKIKREFPLPRSYCLLLLVLFKTESLQ